MDKNTLKITSTTNDLIKETAKLKEKKYRTLANLFILEGAKSIEEATFSNLSIETIFVLNDKYKRLYSTLKNTKIIEITEAVMKKIATTDSVPEILAIAHQIEYSIKDMQKNNKLILLENIKDVNNLGTIIRTSVALGAEGIILLGDTVDIYNPKTVRSAVGNMFKIPFIHIKTIKEFLEKFSNYTTFATVVKTQNTKKITEIDLPEKSIIMFGSEAFGLSQELIEKANVKMNIPINQQVESLNLSTAVTVCLWELFN